MAEVHDATPAGDYTEKDVERDNRRQSRAGSMAAATNLEMIEAPVTWKAYLLCAFASFGGIFFGYDSGYINGVTGSPVFIEIIEGPGAKALSGPNNSLIVSILSAGTFFGALIAGDCADFIGRRTTIVIGCGIYIVGVALQIASHGLGLIVAGRLVAGVGVGFESAIVILYMSEIVSQDTPSPSAHCLLTSVSSVRRKSAARWSLATSFVSQSVSCWLPV
jgi:MFS family permease